MSSRPRPTAVPEKNSRRKNKLAGNRHASYIVLRTLGGGNAAWSLAFAYVHLFAGYCHPTILVLEAAIPIKRYSTIFISRISAKTMPHYILMIKGNQYYCIIERQARGFQDQRDMSPIMLHVPGNGIFLYPCVIFCIVSVLPVF
jgi:hypothetical protein